MRERIASAAAGSPWVMKVCVGGASGGGLDLLEDLQDHKNEQVYQRAVAILETFFQGEAADIDENVAPNHTQPSKLAVGAPVTFAFGVSNANVKKPVGTFAF